MALVSGNLDAISPAERRRLVRLRPFLDAAYQRRHRPEYLGTDPVALAHEFSDPAEREIAAWFCALLAYGNVKQIQASARALFARMDGAPRAFVLGAPLAGVWGGADALSGFRHRFTDEHTVRLLCWQLRRALRQHGSLAAVFMRAYDGAAPNLMPAAARFMELITGVEGFPAALEAPRTLASQSYRHFVPDPRRGSACKRLHMFLRWMVRPADGIELGLWAGLPGGPRPDQLVLPLDTHVSRLAGRLGLLSLQQAAAANGAAALRATAALRCANSRDPVGYDFALCRLGILKACPLNPSAVEHCAACELAPVCTHRRQLLAVG